MPPMYNMVHYLISESQSIHTLKTLAGIGLQHVCWSLKKACVQLGIYWFSPLSIDMRYLQNGKCPVASVDQGCTGISCQRNVLGFCLHLECEYFKHSSQFNTNLSSWSLKSGQYTVSLALSLHLPRPKCPSCMSCNEA